MNTIPPQRDLFEITFLAAIATTAAAADEGADVLTAPLGVRATLRCEMGLPRVATGHATNFRIHTSGGKEILAGVECQRKGQNITCLLDNCTLR